MTKIVYPATSAYAATPQSDKFIGRYVHRTIAPDPDTDSVYVVESKYHNRPEKLAFDLYGKSSLFWVFVARNINLMRDPVWDLEAGMEIIVPSPAYVSRVLGL